jgi:hypothetical protein
LGLELGGDLFLFDFRVWRLSGEEESLSSFRMDFVLDDLDLDLVETFPWIWIGIRGILKRISLGASIPLTLPRRSRWRIRNFGRCSEGWG